MAESFIMELDSKQWNTPAQVIFSLCIYEELMTNPERLSDPSFTGYLLGSLGPQSLLSRDLFMSVVVLGLNVTVSALMGMREQPDAEENVFTPEDLEMPPAIADGLNLAYLRSRDHARDVAAYQRLAIGEHLGDVNMERLAIGRATMLALAATDLPQGIRSNLLSVASFLQWLDGDTEGAGLNAMLASMNDPSNKLPQILVKLYEKHPEPLWRAAQGWRREEAI